MDTTALDDKLTVRRRKRGRALLAVLLSSSLATLGAGAMSLAVFTDSEASNGQWTTGTVDLLLNPSAGFSADGVMPGDEGDHDLNVTNNGTATLRYALTSNPTGTLADEIVLTVSAGTCAAPGATLYTGAASGAAFGDPAQGADAGDRSLAAGGDEDLCFHWELPLATGDAFQDVTADVEFGFVAEQTVNNP